MSLQALQKSGPRWQLFLTSSTVSSCRLAPQINSIRRASTVRSSLFTTQGRGVRVTTVFGALLALGIGSTAYGLYDFYNALALWPDEVRSDLRAGLKARNQDDLDLSERYLRRAYQTALDLPASTFAPSPYLKLSGIAITLASVLEADGRPKEAWDVYVQALSLFPNSPDNTSTSPRQEEQLTPQDVIRQVSIAHKLGEMAEMYGFGEEEEEKWLSWGIQRLLRVIEEPALSGGASREQEEGREEDGVQSVLADLDLPEWVRKTDLCAPMEALGALYARQGKVDFAMALYLQAISLLMRKSPAQLSSVEDRCRGAQIMNNVSSLIMSKPPTSDTLTQAESWAQKSIAVCGKEIDGAKKRDNDQLSVCETTMAVAMFNLASIREMAGDRATARKFFKKSLDQSQLIGMREGIMEAQVALRRLGKADHKSTDSQKAPP